MEMRHARCPHAFNLHVHPVIIIDFGPECLRLSGGQGRDPAEDLALLIHAHLNLVKAVLDPIATKNLPQVLRALLDLLWPAVGKRIVLIGEHILDGRQLVNFQPDQVFLRMETGNRNEKQRMKSGNGCLER